MSAGLATLGWALAALSLATAFRIRGEHGRRRELVARACHELAGPLTAASLALHAARRDDEAPPRRIAAVELELRRAILALGDLWHAPAGRCVSDRTDAFDLGDLLADQVEAWRELARAHGCEVRLGAPLAGTVVLGDRIRIAQATSNLVANAIEHGRGTIELSGRAVGDRVRIEVSDEGPGLPAPVAELAGSARGGRGRRGRGLAIATEIAARHGGRIAAAPAPRGARIALELPVLDRPA